MDLSPLLAVTVRGLPLPGWLVLAVLLWLGYKVVQIAVFPWAACPKCGGRGRFFSADGENWRPCRRCGGGGRRLRLGRRVWDWTTK